MTETIGAGGYAVYVWSAVGFALAVLLGLFLLSWRGASARDAELARLRSEVRETGDSVRRPTLRRAPGA
jgi:heme exporter protein CcmD